MRELRALEGAGKAHPKALKRLLTLTRPGLPTRGPADVEVRTVCDWLFAHPADGTTPL